MRSALILSGLLIASNAPANAQIADKCSLFRSPNGEIKTFAQMEDLEYRLLREARRGNVVDLSIATTAKEVAEQKERQEKARQEQARKRAKVQEELASYKCTRDIYGNMTERG